MCFLYQVDQLINKPTRETNTSATLIDLVLTNAKENISTSGVIDLGMSDHSLIYVVRKFTLPKLRPSLFMLYASLRNSQSEHLYDE